MKGNMDKCAGAAEECKDLYSDLGQDAKVFDQLLMMAKARFWAANSSGVPDEKGIAMSADWERALKSAQDALALARKLAVQQNLVTALFGLAQVHVITKRGDEARPLIDEALPVAQQIEDTQAEANLELLRSQMCIVLSKFP